MTLAGVLWGEAQGSPQPCSMHSSNIGVRYGHPQLIPQGMAALGWDVLRPPLLLQNLGIPPFMDGKDTLDRFRREDFM